jgi:hypothetical protein
MANRKQAFKKGLAGLTRRRQEVYAIRPRLYNAAGMVEHNQIICGNSIDLSAAIRSTS